MSPTSKPRRPKKRITRCPKCGEPTTHRLDVDPETGEEKWTCLCCESAKYRSKEQIRQIRKVRKGWSGGRP